LWFLDGRNESGRIVSNPSVGYGLQLIKYANGSTKEFYQIGISANTTGISIYILGKRDKSYLVQKYGHDLGKARITGYCIKFKRLSDVNTGILEAALRDGIEHTKIENC
jgi:hypothetical protein